jgi:hypothetical protein
VKWKKLALISVAGGVGVAVVVLGVLWGVGWRRVHAQPPRTWDSTTFQAIYVNAQLRQIDRSNASVLLYYNIENTADSDYRLAEGEGLVIMRRLASDHTLSAEEAVHLSYGTFLPAKQRARIALEVPHAFDWPADSDPARQEKLREFVNQRLAGIEEFVLFDQANRFQIEFPKGWQDLPAAPAPKK